MRPHPKARGNPYQRKLFVRSVLERIAFVHELPKQRSQAQLRSFLHRRMIPGLGLPG